MIRKAKLKKADAILTGDWHLRDTTPICRLDDFMAFQRKVLKFVSGLQKKHDCPILHSGDLFEHWKASPYLITFCLKYLPKNFYSIFGNHDLPNHKMECSDKSALQTLIEAKRVKLLDGVHWELKPKKSTLRIKGRRILVWHVMCYQKDPPWPDAEGFSARQLMKKYSKYDLILTGHHHKTVHLHKNGRTVFNAGSLTQQFSDQINQKPVVGLWYADTNTVELVELPFAGSADITDEHIISKQEKKAQYAAFIDKYRNNKKPILDFETNLRRAFKQNKTKKSVKALLLDCLHGEVQ